jgi:cytoskeletal protein CcmA (bactofilin family)
MFHNPTGGAMKRWLAVLGVLLAGALLLPQHAWSQGAIVNNGLQVSDGNVAITNTDNTARQLRLYEPSGAGTNFTAFQAQAQANDIIYTLPASLTPTSTVAAGILQTDGSGNLSWLTPSALVSGSAWALTGNSITGTEFLGTTNAQPLVIRTDNTERMRITATGNVGIGTSTPAATLDVVGTAQVSGNTSVGGNLSVGGNGSVTGNLTVDGNTTLGDASGDAVTVNAGTVSLPNIPSGSAATEVLVWNAGNVERRAASGLISGLAWALTGNSGTNPAVNFLGTTDAQPLVIRVDNQETFRFNPPGASAPAWSIQRGGGDPRGLHAVDLQSARSAATQVASGDYSVIGGGQNNTASFNFATVGGGSNNTASGFTATIGGGQGNTASGVAATVGGGSNNTASGNRATVGGGEGNIASGIRATVGGGGLNTASGDYSAIPGGNNLRVGHRSFGFSGQTSMTQTDLSADTNIAAFVDVDLWLYSRDHTQASQLRFYEAQAHGSGAEYVAFQAPNTLTTSTTYTLPASLTPTSTVAAGILQTDGSGNLSWLTPSALVSGSAWALTGNSGTNPAVNFLGTTDAQPLVIRTDNTERMRITETGNVGIGTSTPAATLDVVGTAQVSGNTSVGGNLSVGGNGSVTGNLTVDGNTTLGDASGDAVTVNAGTVSLPNIPSGSAATEVLVWNAGNVERRAASGLISGLAWALTGNSGTNPAVNFLGTTDAQPLVIRVDNQETFRFNPPGASAPAWSIQRGGGDPRGLHAVDLQSARSAATQVASGDYSVIGGGQNNTASFNFATVGGGSNNTASGFTATIGGGQGNTASGVAATVGGGSNNTASGNRATVGGGEGNIASGIRATVGGGGLNTASGDYSAIPGGNNLRVGHRSFGFSGQTSMTQTDLSADTNIAAFVDVDLWLYSRDHTQASQLRFYEAQAHGSGAEYVAFQAPNTLTTSTTYTLPASLTPTSTVAAGILQTDGSGNLSWLTPSALVSGSAWALTGNSGTNPAVNFLGTTDAQPLVIRVDNQETFRFNPPGASAPAWSIQRGGGDPRGLHAVDLQSARSAATEVASGDYSVIGGGQNNTASGDFATVGGGFQNTASNHAATVSGGYQNTASGYRATVGGGGYNTASSTYATVGGGFQNTASGIIATVGGGQGNTASHHYTTVGGGNRNTASSTYATVGGGFYNTASDYSATVGGGYQNTASGDFATVGGGRQDTASGAYATVGGGGGNTASGDYSAIPGGFNLRVGHRSFGFSGQTSLTQTDLSANSNIAAFVDVDLWLYSRDRQASQLRFYEAQAHGSGAEYVAFQAPNTLTTSTTYTLPASLTPTSTVAAGILQTDGSGNLSWLTPSALVSGSAWALTGNSGTNPAVNFLGTTDAQPLVIRTNNTERMRVTETGNVGIGTSNPQSRLHVHGSAVRVTNSSTGSTATDGFVVGLSGSDAELRQYENARILFNTNAAAAGDTVEAQLTSTGQLAFFTTGTPGFRVDLPNNSANAVGRIRATGISFWSSMRWKEDIRPIPNALEKALALRGVNFRWKPEYGGGEDIGFIMEEVDRVVPEVVQRDERTGELLGMDYARLTALLVEALKEEHRRNEALRAEVAELRSLVEQLLRQNGERGAGSQPSTIQDAWLGQNIPNPFAGTTTIPYYIPAGVSRAELVVRDVGGRELKRLELAERGAHGQVVLEMGLMGSGTYEYALVLDGRVVAVKQMTLVR